MRDAIEPLNFGARRALSSTSPSTDPDAWKRAREIASSYPFRGVTPAEAVQALDDVMQSIGDTCPRV
jgi:hypothetical protein